MSDGYLNKCKDCAKNDSNKRYNEKILDPSFVESERIRQRDKYKRLNYKEKQKIWDKKRPWTNKIKSLNRDLNVAKGFECHHWNYNDSYLKDVFILPIKTHKKAHKYLTLDFNTKMFFSDKGELLDTREKHEKYLIEKGVIINNLNKNHE